MGIMVGAGRVRAVMGTETAVTTPPPVSVQMVKDIMPGSNHAIYLPVIIR